MTNGVLSFTISNPTAEQMAALQALMTQTNTGADAPAKKRGRPAKTVSPDEDEDFGKEELEEEDLADEEETEEADEEESDEAEEEADEEEDAPKVSFDQVKAAINKYGATHPKQMKAIYASFKIKDTKELKSAKTKWAPVYVSVLAKLKELKKSSKK